MSTTPLLTLGQNNQVTNTSMRTFLSLFLLLAALTVTTAQDFAPIDKSVMDAAYYPSDAAHRTFAETEEERAASEPKIRVLYSRPLKQGREIFGGLLKYGEPWRVGANESTEILFLQDVTFGDTEVAAGRYSLIVVPNEDAWTVHLSAQLDGWGNYGYDPAEDVTSITVPTQESEEVIESISITLYEASPGIVHLKMGWDDTFAEVPIGL